MILKHEEIDECEINSLSFTFPHGTLNVFPNNENMTSLTNDCSMNHSKVEDDPIAHVMADYMSVSIIIIRLLKKIELNSFLIYGSIPQPLSPFLAPPLTICITTCCPSLKILATIALLPLGSLCFPLPFFS